jgi:hypothetical protein
LTPAASGADAKDLFEGCTGASFNPIARDLVEDRLAEGVGVAFDQYILSTAKGRPMDESIMRRLLCRDAVA